MASIHDRHRVGRDGALMELRLLELAISLLDPRKWRLRLAQGGILTLLAAAVWARAVQVAPERVAVRDARRAARNERIRARNAELEREWYAGDGDPA